MDKRANSSSGIAILKMWVVTPNDDSGFLFVLAPHQTHQPSMRFLFIFVSRFLGTFLVIRYSCDTILIDMFKISGFSIAVDISNFDLI
jgi:hypothetical protein